MRSGVVSRALHQHGRLRRKIDLRRWDGWDMMENSSHGLYTLAGTGRRGSTGAPSDHGRPTSLCIGLVLTFLGGLFETNVTTL